MSYRGRFAPSPTGDLHAGSLVTALASLLRAHQQRGCWLVRMEDIDPAREVVGSARSILGELERLQLIADERVMYQSDRKPAYQRAFDALYARDLVFPCWCSRRVIREHGGVHRDGRCFVARDPRHEPAWRLRVPDATIRFDDPVQGPQAQNLREVVGDFVLRRADGGWAYQLACVVDDAAQGVSEIVRGVDLMDSTARQIHLQHLLGVSTPDYLHLPLVTDAQGRKLAKSDADAPLHSQPAERVIRHALVCLGIDTASGQDVSRLLEDAVQQFDIMRLAAADTLPWTGASN